MNNGNRRSAKSIPWGLPAGALLLVAATSGVWAHNDRDRKDPIVLEKSGGFIIGGYHKTIPSTKETVLKKFDPKMDKPFQTEVDDRRVTVDGDAWRIDARARPPAAVASALRLFDLP